MRWPPAVLPAGRRGTRPQGRQVLGLVVIAALMAMATSCTSHVAKGSPAIAGSTAPSSNSSKPSTPTPLTVAQVTALAERDLRLLVDVDYRYVESDFAAAEAQLTPEFKAAFIEAATKGGPDIRGHLQTKVGVAEQQIVDTIRVFTSVTTETSDPAFPAATLQIVVRHEDRSSHGAVDLPARVRLTFANRSGRWLVANEEIDPGGS